MISDKQRLILEAAAKACGINIYGWADGKAYVRADGDEYEWNPLTSPADCAEMCAELFIDVRFYKDLTYLACGVRGTNNHISIEIKDHDNSRVKAWMAAATIVAARIGGYKE